MIFNYANFSAKIFEIIFQWNSATLCPCIPVTLCPCNPDLLNDLNFSQRNNIGRRFNRF